MTIIKQDINLSLLQEWLIQKIASLTSKNILDINIDIPLADYGLDSMHAIGLSGEIEDQFGIAVEPTLAWDYPTIDLMARYLITVLSAAIKLPEMNQKVA